MSTTGTDISPLFTLLARQWSVEAQVRASAFAHDGASLAFALADGTLALVSMDDPEAAGTRWRMSIENGRSMILPRARPVPAPTRIPVGEGPLCLAPFGRSGFLVGDAVGRVIRIAADGAARTVVEHDSAGVEALAACGDGAAWVAAGGQLTCYDADGEASRAMAHYDGIARGIAPSPDGDKVALACDAGLSLLDLDGPSRPRFDITLGPIEALAWSPDQSRLAIGLLKGGVALVDMTSRHVLRLPDYPAPVRTLDWSADSRRLITGGAFRTIVWRIGEGRERPGTLETGRSGFVVVEATRLHPHMSLIAAGYENGMIVITAIGQRDELVVRDPMPGGLRDLRWSPDGEHLAFHAAPGWAGVIDLPAHMFKQIERRTA